MTTPDGKQTAQNKPTHTDTNNVATESPHPWRNGSGNIYSN